MKTEIVVKKLIDQIAFDVQEPGRRFVWNKTHQKVAERLGCSPRLLKKLMSELVSSGLLTTNGGRGRDIAYFATEKLFAGCSSSTLTNISQFTRGRLDHPLENRCFLTMLFRSTEGTPRARQGHTEQRAQHDLGYWKDQMCPRGYHDSRGSSPLDPYIGPNGSSKKEEGLSGLTQGGVETPDRQTSSTESLGDAVVVHDKLVELTYGLVRYDETFRQAHLELIRETGLLSEELEGLVEHFFRTRVTTDRLTRPTFKNVVDPVVVAEYRQTVALTEKRLRKLAQQEYREHRKVDREALAEKALTDLALRGATEELREESAELLGNKKEHSVLVFIDKVEELVARHELICRENQRQSHPEH